VRGRATKVRSFIRDSVNGGNEPPESGKTLGAPVLVEVVGQLFYDSAHGIHDKRGKGGMPAATLWELHPVMDIRTWTSEQGRDRRRHDWDLSPCHR